MSLSSSCGRKADFVRELGLWSCDLATSYPQVERVCLPGFSLQSTSALVSPQLWG